MANPNKPKQSKAAAGRKLWEGIDIIRDFTDGEDSAEEVDIGEYNKEKMTIFSANVNYARQLTRLSDSLKPVERRALFTMYEHGLKPGNKEKSISLVGAVTKLHPHGGTSVYGSIINMSQYWKKPLPLIRVYGQGGTETSAIYAADRYTEVSISQYAWDCFFKDYDPDCVQTIFSTSANIYEPLSLPSRYPNALINGGIGIAVGNAFKIPTFNIDDIIRETKKMLYNDTGAEVYLVPDFPTGCDIVNDTEAIKQMCETGRANLKLRARTEIIDEGKHWCIRVTNLPWPNVTQEAVVSKLVTLTKSGALPIKDVQDRCEQVYVDPKTVVSHVDLAILIDKAHDPYAVREKLFSKTPLEDTLAVDMKAVLEELAMDRFSLANLIRNWIEERREYKRRLLNKRIVKTASRIEMLKILIEMCTGTNLDKTVRIIKSSRDSELAKNLIREYGMSSYQAERIADMRMGAFTKDALERYKAELKEKQEELKHLYDMVKSEKYIDDIIASELDELKKYAKPRQSRLIDLGKGKVMDTTTEYFLIATKRGGIKKVSVDAVQRGRRGFGSFEPKDYPTHILRVKNLDSVLFVDSFGKFSIVNAGEIDTMSLTDVPAKAFTSTKLEGEIIAMQYFMGEDTQEWMKKAKAGKLYLVTISRDGFVKRINLQDIIDMTDNGRKVIKNMRLTRLRSNDFLAHAGYYLGTSSIVIYTKRGQYNHIVPEQIPEYSNNAIGNKLVELDGDDVCVGCCAVDQSADYIVVVTAKGCMKKCELDYLGKPDVTKATSYLATLDGNDEIVYVDTPRKMVDVCTKLTHHEIVLEDIKTLGRKAKPAKKIQLGGGDNIIRVVTH